MAPCQRTTFSQGIHKCARLKVVAVAIYVFRIATQNKRVIVRCLYWHTICMEVRDRAAELNVSDQQRQGHELVMRSCLRSLQTQAFQSAACTHSQDYSQLSLFLWARRYSRAHCAPVRKIEMTPVRGCLEPSAASWYGRHACCCGAGPSSAIVSDFTTF